MKIVYLSTSKVAGTINFESTLKKLGYFNEANVEIIALGRGETFNGWKYRMKKYLDYCNSLSPNEIVMLTDADDVLFCRRFEGLIETFEKHHKPLMVAAQPGSNAHSEQCYPIHSYIKQHPEANGFEVNGGGMVGYAKNIGNIYQWGLARQFTDDQRMLGAYVDSHIEEVYLDINADIFYVLQSQLMTSQITWTDGSLKEVQSVVRTGKKENKTPPVTCRPYLFHFAFEFYKTTWASVFLGKFVQHAEYTKIGKQLLNDEYLNHQYNRIAVYNISLLLWISLSIVILLLLALIVVLCILLPIRKRYMSLKKVMDNEK